jgi:transposase
MKRTAKTRSKKSPAIVEMQPQVAGIDIGSREHWVAGPPGPNGESNVRSFGTTTSDLVELVRWLKAQRITSAAMESTSVYWIPLYELLEAHDIKPVLVDTKHVHNVPGRAKTDCLDCQWLQLLHSRGLLRAAFRPGNDIARIRTLQRQLSNFVEERTRSVQWMQKALDQMNVQVHHAVTDITGKTGMAIVRSIVSGERDPRRLAVHRDPHCRKSVDEIAKHLTGSWRDEHLFNLGSSLRLYDSLEQMIAEYEAHIVRELEALHPPERRDHEPSPNPNRAKERSLRAKGTVTQRTNLWRFAGVDLTRIDAIGADAAQRILTEVGTDLSMFPTEHHFVSWVRLAPRTAFSGGRRLRARRNGLGATRVANVLRMAAASLHHSKTALGAAYRRIARKKGAGVAVFAMARRLAELVYRMLRYGQDYVDVGEQVYERRFETMRIASLTVAARDLGYTLVKQDPTVAA